MNREGEEEFYFMGERMGELPQRIERRIWHKMRELSGLSNDEIEHCSEEEFDRLYEKAIDSLDWSELYEDMENSGDRHGETSVTFETESGQKISAKEKYDQVAEGNKVREVNPRVRVWASDRKGNLLFEYAPDSEEFRKGEAELADFKKRLKRRFEER